jgi:hypothetical protein
VIRHKPGALPPKISALQIPQPLAPFLRRLALHPQNDAPIRLESKKMKAKYELLVSELQMQRFPRQTQLLPRPSAICHLVLCDPHVAAPKL